MSRQLDIPVTTSPLMFKLFAQSAIALAQSKSVGWMSYQKYDDL